MATVDLPNQLRSYAGGASSVSVAGLTVGEVLQALVELHPALKDRMYEPDGELRTFLNVYLDDEDIRYLDDLNTPIGNSKIVAIIPNASGG